MREHSRRFLVTLVMVATVLVVTTTVRGNSPQADRIARSHADAIGWDRLRSIEAVRAEGVVKIRRFSVPFTLYKQRPDLSRLEVKIMGYDLVQAYDGHLAWWVNPLVGASNPEVMPADFSREVRIWSDFEGPLIGYRQKRNKLKYLGKEKLPTGDAYKLRVATTSGDEVFTYVDCETYMEVQRTHTQFFRGEATEVKASFSNFVETNGLVTPRTITGVGFGGEPFKMTLETIDFDIEPDARRFKLPGSE